MQTRIKPRLFKYIPTFLPFLPTYIDTYRPIFQKEKKRFQIKLFIYVYTEKVGGRKNLKTLELVRG